MLWAADDAAPANKANDKPAEAAKTNPYLPKKGMSVEDLKAYIDRMQEAPETIRNRPGFAEGMAVAAQRILDSDPQGSLRTFAVTQLLDALHQWADLDESQEADKRLTELAKKYASDSDKKIASDAEFYLFEQRVLKADDLDLDKVPALLDEVKSALIGKPLDAKYQRVAAATVHQINRLKDDAEATKRIQEFGELFATSSDPLLSRYGKKLLKAGGDAPSEWTGKPMELAGTTVDGQQFDIAKYKGKVVIVDFWATWCGPCRESLPDLKDVYEKYHDKGLEVVGVSLDSELSDLTDFLDKEKLPWVNIVGEEKDGKLQFPLADKYGITGIPTTFFVGRDGKIVSQTMGAGDPADLVKQVEKLLEAKPEEKK
jgi:thiol-disulfide isomerase/thioredoxin